MEYEEILYTIEEGLCTITFNNPESMNATSQVMRQEVRDAMEKAKNDDTVKVIMFIGAGRAFSAGENLRKLSRRPENVTRDAPTVNLRDIPELFAKIDKPIVAAVNGAAAGDGFEVACNSDIRLASERAKFASAYSTVGFMPPCGSIYSLPRIVGMGYALDLMWPGKVINADEAFRIGLVQSVWPEEEFRDMAKEYCMKLAKGPLIAINAIKKAAYASLNVNSIEESLDISEPLSKIVSQSEDAKEGPKAFVEKRPPNFQGK